MRRSLFAVLLAGPILWAHPAAAEAVLAVGLPPAGLSHGFVYGYAGGADGAATALKYCRGQVGTDIPDHPSEAQKYCHVVGTFTGKCVAVALDGDFHNAATGVGWAFAADLRSAESQALAKCEAMAGPGRRAACKVQKSGCDSPAK